MWTEGFLLYQETQGSRILSSLTLPHHPVAFKFTKGEKKEVKEAPWCPFSSVQMQMCATAFPTHSPAAWAASISLVSLHRNGCY